MSRIGDLTVRIGADITRLQTGMRRAQGEVSQAVKAMAAVGAAAAAASAGVVAFTKSSADGARELRIMASVANTTTQELQRISFATRTVGIEQDKLADILKDVNDRVGDFLNTGGGEMADFFEKVAPQVGVTAEQFRNLSGPQALQLYYDTLQRANLSQAEMTFYLESMASDATALAPLLRDNGAALNDLAGEADQLGIVLSDLDIAMLGEFSSEFDRAAGIVKGVVDLVSAELAPILTIVIERINKAAIESGGWGEVVAEAVESTVKGIGAVLDAIELVRRAFQVVGRVATLTFISAREAVAKLALAIYSGPIKAANALIELYNKIPALPNLGEGLEQPEFVKDLQFQADMLGRAAQLVREDIKELVGRPMPSSVLDDVIAQAKTLREEIAAGLGDGGQTGATGGATGVSEEKRRKEELDRLREHLGQRVELLRESLMTEQELETSRYLDKAEELADARDLEIIGDEEHRQMLRDLAQQHEEKISEITAKGAGERTRLQEQEARDRQQAIDSMMNNMISLTSSGSKKLFQIGKVAAIANAVMKGYEAVVSSYAYGAKIGGPPVGAAMAAAAGAATFAQIQNIRSQQFSGGGSTASAGSAGGSGASGGASGGQPAQPAAPSGGTLTVQGISSSSLFTGDAMRELAEEMLDYQRRGGEVVLA